MPFNERANQIIIAEFWQNWKNAKFANLPLQSMKEAIEKELSNRGLKTRKLSEADYKATLELLIRLLSDALLATQET